VYNGAILGVQGGTDIMLDFLDISTAQGIQVSGLWIQDWSGKITTEFGTRVFWNWAWNSTWYPDLNETIKYLDEKRNIKVTAYLTAHLNTDGDVYKSAENEEYWLSTNEGTRLLQDFGEFDVATVDIIKPSPDCNCINTARNWYKDLMKKNLIDFGFAGWMADFGEYTPTSARTKFADRWWRQEHGEILHQIYPEEWAQVNREVVEEAGKLGEVMYWMRSGGLSSKSSQVMSWAGDQTVDWTHSDGLPSSIISALSLSLSGMGLTHSDIGGYTTIGQLNITRSKELLLRWAEYAAFTPIMRTHEGNQPEVNHQFYSDVDTLQQFARLTQIYVALSNYTKEAVNQNAEEHIPVMRPIFLMFENDPEAYSVEYEYMYGDDLLVAPVLEPGVDLWDVYLPAGPDQWVHLWDLFEYDGGEHVSVDAVLGNPPVFFRKSSKLSELIKSISASYSLV
jgi:alpha-glucosidase